MMGELGGYPMYKHPLLMPIDSDHAVKIQNGAILFKTWHKVLGRLVSE